MISEIKEIPKKYYAKSDKQGKLEEFYYNTNETTSLGTPNNPGQFKNIIDHAIENEEIRPIIIVCPTYNNESSEDSGDYTLAYGTLTVNYHNELINDFNGFSYNMAYICK